MSADANRTDLPQLVLAALRRHGIVPAHADWRVRIAPAGSTDRTFTVDDPAGTPTFTARLARPGLEHELLHEEEVLRELAAGGSRWSPRDVHRIDDPQLPEGHLLLHKHMPGTPRRVTDGPVAALTDLGEALAWVHHHPRSGFVIWPSLDVRRGTRADAFRARQQTLSRYASLAAIRDAGLLAERIAGAELPRSAGWQDRGFALLHGDLSLGNILWDDNRVALIDWEFARAGDPAEDLAYLVAEQDLRPDLVADLADDYVVAGGDSWALARMPVWLPLVALDAALWWADYRLAHGDDPAEDAEIQRRVLQVEAFLPS